jgi:dihydrolipoamide dehydrogenase
MTKRITIIGGGPGGYVAAIRAAQLGAEVHVAEGEYFGGTCLNVGCIPTKALLHVAETYQAMLHGKTMGLNVESVRVDWPAVMKYKQTVASRLVKGVEGLLKANGVTLHRGHAHVKDARTVEINGSAIESDAILLATGSEPARLTFPGADVPGVIDSTSALRLEKLPSSMVVLGGGVVGVEFAALYNAFGCTVTIVEILPHILPGIDGEIAQEVRKEISRNGVTVLTAARLLEVKERGSQLVITVEADGQQKDITAEFVLVSVGRRPRTGGMGLEAVGVRMDRGRIIVDNNFVTNIPGMYAVGDCSSAVMLAHVSSAQGVAAVEHALGHTSAYYGHIIPACIYISPEVACVGLTEEQARAQGLAYKTGVFQLAGNGKAIIESNGTGMIKIVAGAVHGEILGVHIFGPRATDIITEAALAMRLEATVDELISTIHAHPTVGEAMVEAALAVEGNAIHWPPEKKTR